MTFISVTQPCPILYDPMDYSMLARLPCPSPTLRAWSNSCSLRQWWHPTISSSVVPFSSRLRSFPASGSFPISWLFTSGDQSIGASASASVLPMNIQDWFPLRLTGWISLESKGLSRVFSNITVQKHQFLSDQLSLWPNSHPDMTTGKTITLTRWTFVSKVSSLIFNMLPRFVMEKEMETHSSILVWKIPQMGEPGMLQSMGSQESDMTERLHSVLSAQVCHSFSSKEQESFNFMTAVTIYRYCGAPQNKVCHCFHCLPIYLPWTDGTRCMILVFWMLGFKPAFSLLFYTH